MDVLPPAHVQLPPPGSSNRLHSPEPSGTPDMKRISSHRGTPSFGFGYQISCVSDDSDSQRIINVEKSMSHSSYEMESRVMKLGNIYLSDSNLEGVENGSERVNLDQADWEINTGSDHHGKTPVGQVDAGAVEACRLQCLQSSLESHVHKCHSWVSNDTLMDCLQSEEQVLAETDVKFLDLVLKVTSLHSDQSETVSNSTILPVHGSKNTSTISELQKKISDLKVQVTKERSSKHAVAQQLSSFWQESAKLLQQKQKIWESKFRELQKQKHALSAQLQKLDSGNPRHLLARGEEVSLTKEELKRLRQDIQEQESLIKGYQMENEKVLQKLREVQICAKEKEKKMAEEIVALMDQLSCSQTSATPKLSKEAVYASLSETLTLRGEISDAKGREETLRNELDKTKDEKKHLEQKVLDLEEALKIKQTSFRVPTLDVSCECMLNFENNIGSSKHGEDVETDIFPEDLLESKVENHENHETKENLLKYEDILKARMEEREKKIQSLQKRMEKMKREYELRIRELKDQIQKKLDVKSVEHESSRKVKDLEAQITEIRSFYMKKIKDLNEKLNTKQTLLDQYKLGTLKRPRLSKNLHERIVVLENVIAEKDATIKSLEEELLITKKRGVGKLTRNKNEEATKNSCDGLGTRNLEEAKDQGDHEHDLYEKGVVQLSGLHRKSASTVSKQIGSSQEVDSQELISCGRHDQGGIVCENCGPASSFSGEHQQHSACCNLEHSTTNKCKFTGHEKVFTSRHEDIASDLKPEKDIAMHSMNPNQQLEVLKRKVMEMEERQNQRECEWQHILMDTKRLLSLEQDMTDRKWELALEVKNSEIERFKLELESILEAAIKLQKAQLKQSALCV